MAGRFGGGSPETFGNIDAAVEPRRAGLRYGVFWRTPAGPTYHDLFKQKKLKECHSGRAPPYEMAVEI